MSQKKKTTLVLDREAVKHLNVRSEIKTGGSILNTLAWCYQTQYCPPKTKTTTCPM